MNATFKSISAALLVLLALSFTASAQAQLGHVDHLLGQTGVASNVFPSAQIIIASKGSIAPGEIMAPFYQIVNVNSLGALAFSVQETFTSSQGVSTTSTYTVNTPIGTESGVLAKRQTDPSQSGAYHVVVTATDANTGILIQSTAYDVLVAFTPARLDAPFRIGAGMVVNTLKNGMQTFSFYGHIPYSEYLYSIGLPPFSGASYTVVNDLSTPKYDSVTVFQAGPVSQFGNVQQFVLMAPDGSYSQTITFQLPAGTIVQ